MNKNRQITAMHHLGAETAGRAIGTKILVSTNPWKETAVDRIQVALQTLLQRCILKN